MALRTQPSDQPPAGNGQVGSKPRGPYDLPSIRELSPLAIEPEPGEFPDELPLPAEAFAGRDWAPQTFSWEASKLRHLPLYFEDMPLERYGHSLGVWQPIWSTGQFAAQLLLLPYQMGIEPPLERIYALGYDRPGDCTPRLWYQFPISRQGALNEAACWALGIVTIP